MTLSRLMYHACRQKDLSAIMKNGLDPSFSRSRSQAIYLASARDVAVSYSLFDPEADWVLLTIRASDLDPAEFGPDDYELRDRLEVMDEDELEEEGLYPGIDCRDVSWQDSLRLCHQAAYFAVIPPTAITNVELIPKVRNIPTP